MKGKRTEKRRGDASIKVRQRGKELDTRKMFSVVGIGASAGGLDAFERLLRHLPSNTGMAFVFGKHLDPSHESRLSEILTRNTRMKVAEVRNGMHVEPNKVYAIPPNMDMRIMRGALSLEPRRNREAQ